MNKRLDVVVVNQKKFLQSNKTMDLEFRINSLKLLKQVVKVNEDRILEALFLDLGKCHTEGLISELGVFYEECNLAINKLKKWSKTKYHLPSITLFPSIAMIKKVPKGVVLILSPWNYPVNLTLIPLVSSIAAGNTSIIRLSEKAFNTRLVLEEIINTSFDSSYIYFDNYTDKNEILNQDYDHIFFTGSTKVAKEIMKKASNYLTPLTMELGGKSPCIVDKNVNLQIVSRRIVWGKMMNCGQTCVAPDYLVVHEDIKDELIKNIEIEYNKLYPNTISNIELPKIISKDSFNRLDNLINNSIVLLGGERDYDNNKISLTIVDGNNSPAMDEEIFGPILPLLTFNNKKEIINLVKMHDNPLALYVFSSDDDFIDFITDNLSYGGLTINDLLVSLSDSKLPFGGVKSSGLGQYHGKFGFDELSRNLPILKRFNILDFSFRYPPYTNKLDFFKKLFK